MYKKIPEVVEKRYGQCRCCLKYAPVRSMWEQYKDPNTDREVYGKMLVDCFSISWTIMEKADDDIICETCVSRLRHAINFKKEVLQSQDKLLEAQKALNPAKPEDTPQEVVIIQETMKQAPKKLRTPKPLTKPKVDSPIPKKTSYNYVTPMIENENNLKVPITLKNDFYEVPVVNKKKNQEVQTERSEMRREEIEEVLIPEIPNYDEVEFLDEVLEVSQDDDEDIPLIKRRKRGKKQVMEPKQLVLDKHRENIRSILIASNATPIRGYWGVGYTCCFCSSQFSTPEDLKQHTFSHEDTPFKFKVRNLFEHVVKLDITGLKCNMCDINMHSLTKLMHHIKQNHEMPMHLDIPNHIIPYEFESESLTCVECPSVFDSFKSLSEHMSNVHYRNYVCYEPSCNQAFVNFQSLKTHSISHGICMVASSICGKVFSNKQQSLAHEQEHLNSNLKCVYGNRAFADEIKKKLAEIKPKTEEVTIKSEEVQVKPQRVVCATCPAMFESTQDLLDHVKAEHIEHKYKCTECDKYFFLKQGLKNHMINEHSSEKRQCPYCPKTWPTMRALRIHMKVHTDEKDYRHQCEVCEQKFQYKVQYMAHMEERHGLSS